MAAETNAAYEDPEREGSEPPLETNLSVAGEGVTEVPTPPPAEAAPTIQTPERPSPSERVPGPTPATPGRAPRAAEGRDGRREITDEDRVQYKLEMLVATGLAKPDDVEKSTPEEKQALIRDRFDKKFWQKYSEPWLIEAKKPGQIEEDRAFDFVREFLEKDIAPLVSGEITIEFVRATDFEDQRECTDRKLIMKRNGIPFVTLRLQATTNQGPEVKEKMERAERTRLKDPNERVVPVELPSVTAIQTAGESVDPTSRNEIALGILEEARVGMEKHRQVYGEGLREYNNLVDTARERAEKNRPEVKPKKYARRAPKKLKSPPRVIWTRGQED